jgi:hypothetical protein
MRQTIRRTAATLLGGALATVAAVFPAAPASAALNTFTIHNVNSSKCLAIGSSSKVNGARAIQWTCNGDTDQKWKLQWSADGSHHLIINVNSGLCLTVQAASMSNGAAITQWTCTYKPEQYWANYGPASGTRIRNSNSDLNLAIPASSKANGTGAVQWATNSSNDQVWISISA